MPTPSTHSEPNTHAMARSRPGSSRATWVAIQADATPQPTQPRMWLKPGHDSANEASASSASSTSPASAKPSSTRRCGSTLKRRWNSLEPRPHSEHHTASPNTVPSSSGTYSSQRAPGSLSSHSSAATHSSSAADAAPVSSAWRRCAGCASGCSGARASPARRTRSSLRPTLHTLPAGSTALWPLVSSTSPQLAPLTLSPTLSVRPASAMSKVAWCGATCGSCSTTSHSSARPTVTGQRTTGTTCCTRRSWSSTSISASRSMRSLAGNGRSGAARCRNRSHAHRAVLARLPCWRRRSRPAPTRRTAL